MQTARHLLGICKTIGKGHKGNRNPYTAVWSSGTVPG